MLGRPSWWIWEGAGGQSRVGCDFEEEKVGKGSSGERGDDWLLMRVGGETRGLGV